MAETKAGKSIAFNLTKLDELHLYETVWDHYNAEAQEAYEAKLARYNEREAKIKAALDGLDVEARSALEARLAGSAAKDKPAFEGMSQREFWTTLLRHELERLDAAADAEEDVIEVTVGVDADAVESAE